MFIDENSSRGSMRDGKRKNKYFLNKPLLLYKRSSTKKTVDSLKKRRMF